MDSGNASGNLSSPPAITITRHVTDDELMARCRTGGGDAFAELFDRHRSAVWSFFRRRVPDPRTAEDLTQDTFVALLGAASRYEPRNAFRSYLFGIAYRTLLDARRRGRVQALSMDDVAEPPGCSTDLTAVLAVRRAVEALDAIDREVVLLREFAALSYADIAALLAIPLNTVRSRLFRARVALKEHLS